MTSASGLLIPCRENTSADEAIASSEEAQRTGVLNPKNFLKAQDILIAGPRLSRMLAQRHFGRRELGFSNFGGEEKIGGALFSRRPVDGPAARRKVAHIIEGVEGKVRGFDLQYDGKSFLRRFGIGGGKGNYEQQATQQSSKRATDHRREILCATYEFVNVLPNLDQENQDLT